MRVVLYAEWKLQWKCVEVSWREPKIDKTGKLGTSLRSPFCKSLLGQFCRGAYRSRGQCHGTFPEVWERGRRGRRAVREGARDETYEVDEEGLRAESPTEDGGGTTVPGGSGTTEKGRGVSDVWEGTEGTHTLTRSFMCLGTEAKQRSRVEPVRAPPGSFPWVPIVHEPPSGRGGTVDSGTGVARDTDVSVEYPRLGRGEEPGGRRGLDGPGGRAQGEDHPVPGGIEWTVGGEVLDPVPRCLK